MLDILLGWTSANQWRWSVLFKDTKLRPWWDSNPQPCDQESDALQTELSVLPTDSSVHFSICTVMIQSFQTDRQIVQKQEQSNQGLHCFLFHFHHFDKILQVWPFCLKFRLITAKISGVRKFRNCMVTDISMTYLYLHHHTYSFFY